MSGEEPIDIRSGGVVAVDTAELRAAAARWRTLAAACDRLRHEVETQTGLLATQDATAWSAVELATALARDLDDAATDAARLARGLADAADVYEIVELEARHRAAVVAGDHRSVPVLARALAAARERDPDAAAGADLLQTARGFTRHAELQRQVGVATAPFGAVGGVIVTASGLALAAIGGLGRGHVSRSDRLRGPASAVDLDATPASAASAPAGMRALVERMPRGGDQVRVERYPQPGGGDRFAVYVTGTRSPLGVGGAEPFDAASNVQLYAGRRSASYEAALAALRDAGARPGDTVLAVGYSQGGAVTSRLATDSPFTVVGNITFGSPVQVEAPRTTLEVSVRHLDDPVSALQAGGSAAPVGAPGSFVVERVVDRGGGLQDLALGAHRLDAYAETAARIDDSGDPRLGRLGELLAALDGGEPAVVTSYRARRDEPGAG